MKTLTRVLQTALFIYSINGTSGGEVKTFQEQADEELQRIIPWKQFYDANEEFSIAGAAASSDLSEELKAAAQKLTENASYIDALMEEHVEFAAVEFIKKVLAKMFKVAPERIAKLFDALGTGTKQKGQAAVVEIEKMVSEALYQKAYVEFGETVPLKAFSSISAAEIEALQDELVTAAEEFGADTADVKAFMKAIKESKDPYEEEVAEAELLEKTVAKKCAVSHGCLKKLNESLLKGGEEGKQALEQIRKIISNANEAKASDISTPRKIPSAQSAAHHGASFMFILGMIVSLFLGN